MTDDEIIAVVHAHKNGNAIQYQTVGGWIDAPEPSWNFDIFNYRVKPEHREWWIGVVGKDIITEYVTKEAGIKDIASASGLELVHVREVEEAK